VRFKSIGSNVIVHLNKGNSVWNASGVVIDGNATAVINNEYKIDLND